MMADPKDPKQPPAEPIEGGPGGEPEPVAPKLVTVKHGGRELQVPEDVAAAWQEREREFDQRFSRQGAELGELRQRVRQPVAPEPKREEPKEPDLSTLWFEDPVKAAALVEQRVSSRLEGQYRRERALEKFWDGFDRVNDDLREDRWLAEAVMNESFDELQDLSPRKAQERLGELVRERILKLTRKTKTPNDDDTRARTLLEPASGDRPPRPPRTEDDGPGSLSEDLRRRRQARLGARSA